MNIKAIYVNGVQYTYRPLSAKDFLDIAEDNDFNIFEIKKPLTMYEKILQEINGKKVENNYNELFYKNVIQNVLKICFIDYPKDFFEQNTEQCKNIQLFLFNNIIISSLKAFKIPPEIDTHSALILDAISKRYGQLPIDILYKKSDYNALDSYLFNREICAIGIKNEIDGMKKQSNKG